MLEGAHFRQRKCANTQRLEYCSEACPKGVGIAEGLLLEPALCWHSLKPCCPLPTSADLPFPVMFASFLGLEVPSLKRLAQTLTPRLPTCAFWTACAPRMTGPEIAQVNLVVTIAHLPFFACFSNCAGQAQSQWWLQVSFCKQTCTHLGSLLGWGSEF